MVKTLKWEISQSRTTPPQRTGILRCSSHRCAPTLAGQAWVGKCRTSCRTRALPVKTGAHALNKPWLEPYFLTT
eukprot:665402-Pelagomonas_calceolata.AAC.1